jgi:hypothetical protein
MGDSHVGLQARLTPKAEIEGTLNRTDTICIQSRDSLKNPNHWKFDTEGFYFKTPRRFYVHAFWLNHTVCGLVTFYLPSRRSPSIPLNHAGWRAVGKC